MELPARVAHTRLGTCITTLHLLRERAVGELLGIPESYSQGCLLPVARLRKGHIFRPAPRRALDEVALVDAWDGAPLTGAARPDTRLPPPVDFRDPDARPATGEDDAVH